MKKQESRRNKFKRTIKMLATIFRDVWNTINLLYRSSVRPIWTFHKVIFNRDTVLLLSYGFGNSMSSKAMVLYRFSLCFVKNKQARFIAEKMVQFYTWHYAYKFWIPASTINPINPFQSTSNLLFQNIFRSFYQGFWSKYCRWVFFTISLAQ